ncbi:MAG: hypothetical protein FWD97_00310 [Defluviitaleaceae bacterium]|nr:hypothetical protein [Defluviitaleaceae bacterium]
MPYDYDPHQTPPPQRSMPRDEQAELALISSMLFDSEALAIGAERVKSTDLYRLDYRVIFTALAELHNAKLPC